ncbi:2Fe-2S iron-sulfur cluster-binding protein [Photobacterium damselae]|uniref:2Fe-2S iron-sulfur cluster-binding protein n=1 Tax=Photobacterium damselae TaxID=38293 RepID=UPI00351A5927
MYQVHLLPLNIKFVVDDKQTLLEAALNAGVAFPHRCQVGVWLKAKYSISWSRC